jgi:hypothetical protein
MVVTKHGYAGLALAAGLTALTGTAEADVYYLLSSQGAIVNPGIYLGFNPQPDPPGTQNSISLIDATNPVVSYFPPGPCTPSECGAGDTVDFVMSLVGLGSSPAITAPLDPVFHVFEADSIFPGYSETSFSVMAAGHDFEGVIDIFGPGAAVGWSAFNPQPDPPGDGFAFEFSFPAPGDPGLSFALTEDGTPLNFQLQQTFQTPLPPALPLFATVLAGIGLLGWRSKRNSSVQPDCDGASGTPRRRGSMIKTARAIVGLALGFMAQTAQASQVTETYNFTLGNFEDGISNVTAPIDSISGSFTLTFDPSIAVDDQTVGITGYLNGSPFDPIIDSAIGFSTYVGPPVAPPFGIAIGGIENDAGGVGPSTNDFILTLQFPTGDVADPVFANCTLSSGYCFNFTGDSAVILGAYAEAGSGSMWFATTGSVSATPLPSTWMMLITGLIALGFFARYSRRDQTPVLIQRFPDRGPRRE